MIKLSTHAVQTAKPHTSLQYSIWWLSSTVCIAKTTNMSRSLYDSTYRYSKNWIPYLQAPDHTGSLHACIHYHLHLYCMVVLHASTVTWTKDCTPVPNDINHLQSQTLLDCDTGTYQSVLTVTGPYYGEYKCQQQRKCCQYRLYHHCSWYVTQWKHSM